MNLRVNRLELLQSLQTVMPGLSPRDIVEQSSCFVFKKGRVITFNDEVACRMPTPLSKEFTGAVTAAPLVAILSKLPEDEVELETTEGELLVKGKRRRAGILMQAEITLPIDQADPPGKTWIPLHDDFLEAVNLVGDCASRDASQFVLTCVNIHPEWIEACDNFQMTRYTLETGLEKPVLVRKESLKHIVALEMKEYNQTANWIHFRNSSGLTLSCRSYLEDYPDLFPLMDFEGTPTELPKGIGEAVEKAEIFSAENSDNNQVRIEMKAGKLRIKGVGNTGWYDEVKNLRYDGPYIMFQISPKLLTQIVQKHNECETTPSRLKVNGGKWTYVTVLGTAPSKKEKKETEE